MEAKTAKEWQLCLSQADIELLLKCNVRYIMCYLVWSFDREVSKQTGGQACKRPLSGMNMQLTVAGLFRTLICIFLYCTVGEVPVLVFLSLICLAYAFTKNSLRSEFLLALQSPE